MRVARVVVAAAALVFAGSARGADVEFNLNDFQIAGSLASRPVFMTPLTSPIAVGSTVVSGDRREYTSSLSGTLTVTNAVTAIYKVEVFGEYRTTTFAILVPDTNATVIASELIVSASSVLPGYADARYVRKTNSWSTGQVATNFTFRGSTNVFTHTNASAGHYLKTDGTSAFWAEVVQGSGGSATNALAKLQGNTNANQWLEIGSTGLVPNITTNGVGANATNTIHLPVAGNTTTGILSSNDWQSFSTVSARQTGSASLTNLSNTRAITNVVSSFGVLASDILYPAVTVTLTNLLVTGWERHSGNTTNEGPAWFNSSLIGDSLHAGSTLTVYGNSLVQGLWGLSGFFTNNLTGLGSTFLTGTLGVGGAATFTNLTASRPVLTDASKNLASGQIDLSSANHVTGTLAATRTPTNTASQAGVVTPGVASKVWKTDGSGNPDWRDDATGGGGSQTPVTQDINYDGFKATNLSRLHLSKGAITATPTNLTGTIPDMLMLGHSAVTFTPTNTAMVNVVTPTGADWVWPPKLVSIVSTGSHVVTFSNAVQVNTLVLRAGDTNWFEVWYDGITNRVFSHQELTTGSGATVLSNAPTIFNATLTGTPTIAGYPSYSQLHGSNYVVDTRQLTVAGTVNQVTSSAGALNLSADRTWTLSLPSTLIAPDNFTVTGRGTNAGVATFNTVTASRAAIFDGNKGLTNSVTTSTELAFVNGVTSAIQTQLDAKQPLDSDLTRIAAQNALSSVKTNGVMASDNTVTNINWIWGTNIVARTTNEGNGTLTKHISSSFTRVGVWRSITIEAGAWRPSATNGATIATNMSGGTDYITDDVYEFDDTTLQSVEWKLQMPQAWGLGDLWWELWGYSTNVIGTNIYGLKAKSVAANEDPSASWGSEAAHSAAGGAVSTTAGRPFNTPTTALTVGGTPALGELVYFKLSRKPADVSDNLVGKSRAAKVVLHYFETTTEPSTP